MATARAMTAPRLTVFRGLPFLHINGQLVTGLLSNFWALVEHLKVHWFSSVPMVYAALLQMPRER